MRYRWKTVLMAGAVGYSLPILLMFFLPWLHALGVTLSPDRLRNWSMFLTNQATHAVCAAIGLAGGAMWVLWTQRSERAAEADPLDQSQNPA